MMILVLTDEEAKSLAAVLKQAYRRTPDKATRKVIEKLTEKKTTPYTRGKEL